MASGPLYLIQFTLAVPSQEHKLRPVFSLCRTLKTDCFSWGSLEPILSLMGYPWTHILPQKSPESQGNSRKHHKGSRFPPSRLR